MQQTSGAALLPSPTPRLLLTLTAQHRQCLRATKRLHWLTALLPAALPAALAAPPLACVARSMHTSQPVALLGWCTLLRALTTGMPPTRTVGLQLHLAAARWRADECGTGLHTRVTCVFGWLSSAAFGLLGVFD